MQKFKQNETTATYRRIYMFLANISDGYTPVTSLVGAQVRLYKNGVAFGSQPTTPATLTHISLGHWYYEIPSGYLSDLGILTVTVEDSNIRNVVLMADVVTYDPTTSTGITAADVWSYVTRDLTAGVAVASVANNAITAASINADAITAAKIADSAITIRLSTDATASEARLIAGTTASDVWNALLASYQVADTFGDRVLRSTNNNNECQVTGSNHIAADIHQLQANVITAAGINTGAIDADALATDAVTEIADGILARDIGSGSNALTMLNERTVRSALRALRNKSVIVGSVLTVCKEDDVTATPAWTAAVSSSASADPVTGVDPD